MPRMQEETLSDFLEEPHIGVITSLRRNGMPYSVPVWWLYDGQAFWITGTTSRVWCKQLKRDPWCSLCIEALSPVAGYVSVDGRAEALELPSFDIWPMSRRLVEKYVGKGDPANNDKVDRFFKNMQTEPRLLFRVTPETSRAIDMRVYRGKKADRDFQATQTQNDRT